MLYKFSIDESFVNINPITHVQDTEYKACNRIRIYGNFCLTTQRFASSKANMDGLLSHLQLIVDF